MATILSSIITAVANLFVFSFIPVAWWFLRYRKETGFLPWIGLYPPKLDCHWPALLLFTVLYLFFYNFDFTQLVAPETLAYLESSDSISSNAYAGLGVAAILPALIETFAANGLAEEILYRGFLCKRLCSRLGTIPGILLQAILFGAMHNLLYLAAGLQVGLWYHALLFFFTGAGALLLGILNETLFNGSIVPSILLHGSGNFISAMLAAFS